MEVLVSINSVSEAALVLDAGVKWIDLKDTSHGALASLSPEVSAQIVEYIHSVKKTHQQNITVSATIGDAFANVDDFVAQLQEKSSLAINIIKIPYQAITLFQEVDKLNETLAQALKQSKVMAVFTPETLLALNQDLAGCLASLKSVGVYGVMLDTLDKAKHLFASLSDTHIDLFIQTARKNDFFVGLAGGLQIQHLDTLLKISPDIVGFRSGISVDNNRKQAICSKTLQLVMDSCDKNTNLHNIFFKN